MALSRAGLRPFGFCKFRLPNSLPSGLLRNSFVKMLKLFEFSGDVDDVVDGNVFMPSILDTSAWTGCHLESQMKQKKKTRKLSNSVYLENLSTLRFRIECSKTNRDLFKFVNFLLQIIPSFSWINFIFWFFSIKMWKFCLLKKKNRFEIKCVSSHVSQTVIYTDLPLTNKTLHTTNKTIAPWFIGIGSIRSIVLITTRIISKWNWS